MPESHNSKQNAKQTSKQVPASIPFSELGLSRAILQSVDEAGYEMPSPIQAETIPHLLKGHDLIGQAQTGTGKTAAFALPLLSQLDMSQKDPQIIVLAPTRELAIQVAEAMQSYARHLKGFHVLPIYGGQNIGIQLKQLRRPVHVVVGTPGRVMDHLRRKTLKLNNLKAVVLDEADEMLRMGFIEDIETILKETPENRQLVLFSATMPTAIRRISKNYLNDPVEIKVKTKTSTVSTISQKYWQGKTTHKLDALTRILESEEFGAIIIFVRTKNMTTELAEKLSARGYAAIALNGDIPQANREKIINRLKKGSLDIIVATDVVARGLDVERITHVINYDMPSDNESYVHRIGRTGRAGRKGTAILFVPPRGNRMLQSIERATGQKIEKLKLPSPQDISDARINRFKQMVIETAASQELDFYQNIVKELEAESELDLDQIAATLAFLVQRDRPLLSTPNDIPDIAFSEQSDTRRNKQRRGSSRPDSADRRQTKHRNTDRHQGKRNQSGDQPPMLSYRIEVGSDHGAMAKHIVGAIANEAGVESKYIQNVSIQSDHSTLDLPDGMPKEIKKHLQGVWVKGQKLHLRELSASKKNHRKQKGKKGSRK
jgi:ATP-dependent RNA helicase DeaD